MASPEVGQKGALSHLPSASEVQLMKRTFAIIAAAVAPLVGCSFLPEPIASLPAKTRGQNITDAGLSMNVTSASLSKAIGPYYAWGPDTTWVVVVIHVSAQDGRPAFFAPMLQQLIFGDQSFEPDPTVAESINDVTASAVSLRPGFADDAALAFLVRNFSSVSTNYPAQVVLRGERNSPGVVVDLSFT